MRFQCGYRHVSQTGSYTNCQKIAEHLGRHESAHGYTGEDWTAGLPIELSDETVTGQADFHSVFPAIPLYDRPCGCEAVMPNHIPTGVRVYLFNSAPSIHDIHECLMCGATWSQLESQI